MKLLALLLFFLTGPVMACTVSSPGLNFGTLDPWGSRSSNTYLEMDCPETSQVQIQITDTHGGLGIGEYGELQDLAGHGIPFGLYTDPAHTQSVESFVAPVGDPITLYGFIPASSTPRPSGTYTDTIQVIISF